MTETVDKWVVDASVIAAEIFHESERHPLAKKIRESKLFAPPLIDYEMGNIFVNKVKRYSTLRHVLEENYQNYLEWDIVRIDVKMSSVIALAEKFNLSVYDASYFFLADEWNIQLLTLDKKLRKAWQSSHARE